MAIRPVTITVTTTAQNIAGTPGPVDGSGFFKVPDAATSDILLVDPDTPANSIPIAAGETFTWDGDYGENVWVEVAAGTEDIYVVTQGVV